LKFEEPAARRLDHFLTESLAKYSRSRIQSWIKDGLVWVDGAPARKSGLSLEDGMQVRVAIPPIQETHLVPEAIELDILFENRDMIAISKPAGMVVHPSAGHSSGTLVNAVLAHAPDIEGIGGEHRPGVVHRLDKDTSGVILMAKNDAAHRFLQNQFRQRTAQKTYLALVDGAPATDTGRIEAAIGRDNHNRKRMAIVPPNKGREAVTKYHVIEKFKQHTLVEAHPLTGRTHQIRLHLAFIGCPIVGDRVYGLKKPSIKLKRHFLHAARLEVVIPGEELPRKFEAPLPSNLRHVLNKLGEQI
jgi:23S rRNA pseudouridine1911/1915/1917 synthase